MSNLALTYGFRPGVSGLARYGHFAPTLAKTLYKASRYKKYMPAMQTVFNEGKRLYKRKYHFKDTRNQKRHKRMDEAPARSIRKGNFIFGTASQESQWTRKTLYVDTIKFADPPTTNEALREAPGMRFYVKGFKLCARFRNNSTAGNGDVLLHMAIIQPREPGFNVGEIQKAFFTDPSSTSDRFQDFVDYITDPTWDVTQDCNGINKRKYNIFTHQKFRISSNTPNTASSSMIKFDKWFRVNKWFEFEKTTSANVVQPYYLCCWYECIKPASTAINDVNANIQTISYISPKKGG